jgi:hypothetical protein
MKDKPKTITKTYIVDPHQSAMALAGCTVEGYRVLKIDRKGNRAKVTYEKLS